MEQNPRTRKLFQANPTDPFGVATLAQTMTGTGGSSSFVSSLFQNTDLSVFFNGLFKTAIAAGAILAVLQLGRAGFMYMTSDIWSKKDKAKQILQNAVLGLALLLAIYVILFQINPNLLNLDIFRVPGTNPITPNANTNSGLPDPAHP